MTDKKFYALFAIFGPLVAYVFIAVSILSAPWFSWWKNALSDLGHSLKGICAGYYNFGLVSAGFLLIIYAVTDFKKHAKYTSLLLTASAFSLQLVAVFDEVYGRLHTTVSVLFFLFLILSCLVYGIEKKSILGVSSFVIGLGSWMLYWAKVYVAGVAVPEIVSATAAISWVVFSALKIYMKKKSIR